MYRGSDIRIIIEFFLVTIKACRQWIETSNEKKNLKTCLTRILYPVKSLWKIKGKERSFKRKSWENSVSGDLWYKKAKWKKWN